MKTLLFIRGVPGTGKHTVGKLLRDLLGWKLFWLHQVDSIYEITGEHRLPRLQDEVSGAILKELCRRGQNTIFVRAAREAATVKSVKRIAERFFYRFVVVRLQAEYTTALSRVMKRDANGYRVCDKASLDEYISSRPSESFDGEHLIWTDQMKPEQVAQKILTIVKSESV